MPPRRDGIPMIVDGNGNVNRLQRLRLDEREISEDWLQQRLFDCPELLPIEEIDPGFGPLVPIGREISTPVGPMDNLYISPQGLLTLVEAKLWRNPQARRTVVGQILDYAKEISRWSYQDLDAKSQESNHKSLYELVSARADEPLDEARFVDAVSRNIRCGRFLLLIVGDGIREEMERLAEFLQATSQLRYTLALIELQIYRLGDGDRLLIMPMVVGRTTEITRAVVHVEASEGAQVNVSLDIAGKEDGSPPSPVTINREEFLEEIRRLPDSDLAVDCSKRLLDDLESDQRFFVDWKLSSFVIKLRDPVDATQSFTILVVQRNGRAYVGWLNQQLARVGISEQLGQDFVRDTAKLFKQEMSPKYSDGWAAPVHLKTIATKYDEFFKRVHEFADAIDDRRVSTDPRD